MQIKFFVNILRTRNILRYKEKSVRNHYVDIQPFNNYKPLNIAIAETLSSKYSVVSFLPPYFHTLRTKSSHFRHVFRTNSIFIVNKITSDRPPYYFENWRQREAGRFVCGSERRPAGACKNSVFEKACRKKLFSDPVTRFSRPFLDLQRRFFLKRK